MHANISRNGYGNAIIGRYGGCFVEDIRRLIVGERSRNSKFSYVSPRSIYGETSNEGRRVHLHTLVDR